MSKYLEIYTIKPCTLFAEISPKINKNLLSKIDDITKVSVPSDEKVKLSYRDFFDNEYLTTNNLQRNAQQFLFRGDKRTPDLIEKMGGMHPKITNSKSPKFKRDQPLEIIIHREEEEEVVNSGLVSFTSDQNIARLYGTNGFVYIASAIGSISDKPDAKNPCPHEKEYSVPGGVDWQQVIAYRECNSKGEFIGKIYFQENSISQYGLETAAKLCQCLLNENEKLDAALLQPTPSFKLEEAPENYSAPAL